MADEIFVAFHHACDLRDLEVAKRLLVIVEALLATKSASPEPVKRRFLSSLVAAHERLWSLRHGDLAAD